MILPGEQLEHALDRAPRGPRPAERRLQRLPLDQLHHEVGRALVAAKVHDPHAVGVIEAREGLGLTSQALRNLRVDALVQQLERDVVVELLVPCAIDRPEAARAEHGVETIAATDEGPNAEVGGGGLGHVWRVYSLHSDGVGAIHNRQEPSTQVEGEPMTRVTGSPPKVGVRHHRVCSISV